MATQAHAYIDARYEGSTGTANSALGQLRPGPLADVISRIEGIAHATRELGNKMRDHADTVFGPVPESEDGYGSNIAQHGGRLGDLFAALEGLDAAQSFLATQCGRNAVLA